MQARSVQAAALKDKAAAEDRATDAEQVRGDTCLGLGRMEGSNLVTGRRRKAMQARGVLQLEH